jgi:hypothetical protein
MKQSFIPRVATVADLQRKAAECEQKAAAKRNRVQRNYGQRRNSIENGPRPCCGDNGQREQRSAHFCSTGDKAIAQLRSSAVLALAIEKCEPPLFPRAKPCVRAGDKGSHYGRFKPEPVVHPGEPPVDGDAVRTLEQFLN